MTNWVHYHVQDDRYANHIEILSKYGILDPKLGKKHNGDLTCQNC